MTGGGTAARAGFDYQDYAAAYYFLTEEHDSVHVEGPEHKNVDVTDFSFVQVHREPIHRSFYQAKEQASGSFSITTFKKIAAKFALVSFEEASDDKACFYRIVSNVAPSDGLYKLITRIDKVRRDLQPWNYLEVHYDHDLFGYIKTRIDQHGTVDNKDLRLQAVLSNLAFEHHRQEFFRSEIESYLKEISLPRHEELGEAILNEIHETSDGIVSREELEERLGVTLERKPDQMSSATSSYEDLRETAREVEKKYAGMEADTSSPVEDREAAVEFVQEAGERGEVDPRVAEADEETLRSEFNRFRKAEQEKRQASAEIEGVLGEYELEGDTSSTDEGEGGS